MSNETPWYFALKPGDKVRRKDTGLTLVVDYVDREEVVGKFPLSQEDRLSYPELWESWEPVPAAPVYPRPDMSDWWCVVNTTNETTGVFPRIPLAQLWITGTDLKIIPYSATTPATQPEPTITVASLKEWIRKTWQGGHPASSEPIIRILDSWLDKMAGSEPTA